jgi:hypothetical protein
MSDPNARRGRHAAPSRTAARRLATAAAALAAGAVPLAAAGAAHAAAASPQSDLQTLGLPNLALPLGLPDSIDPLAAGVPVVQDLPLDAAVHGLVPPVGDLTQVGNLGALPVQGPAAQPLTRSAGLPDRPGPALQDAAVADSGMSAAANRVLSAGAQRATDRLVDALPLDNLMPQLATSAGGPLQLAPHVLQEGALGTLTSGLAPQTDDLTGGLVGQTGPLVAQLHQTGVPTVGDVTTKLSQTRLPMVGTVGSLTGTLPVTGMLGSDSPVTGALQNVSGL